MKVSYCSDLHLNFGKIVLENKDNADVLILAGDIVEIGHFTDYHQKFLDDVAAKFKHVIYVMGNHEHWHGDIAKNTDILRSKLASNIHLLDGDYVDIDDVRFVGGTLWTDMNKSDPVAIMSANRCMNDYQYIKNSDKMVGFWGTDHAGNRKRLERVAHLSVEDTIEIHQKHLKKFDEFSSGHSKVVVVSHHAPTTMSIDSKYVGSTLNSAYVSDLSEFILDRPQIKKFVHGHIHSKMEYNVGSCTVLCNPRGYHDYEQIADFFNLETFEI
jgi:Icc-related predicted phosphoesterase